MPLSDDQRAMLRLLAQREQGYEDMASLMGVSVEELRSRVKDALAELEREGEAAPDLPPPPAADDAGAKPDPATEEPKADPEVPKPPRSKAADEEPELSASPPAGAVPPPDKAEKPAPATKSPATPADKPSPVAKTSSPVSPPPATGSKLSLPKGRGALAGIGAVVAAIVVVVVLLLVLGGGSDSDSTSSTTTPTTAAGNETSEGEAEGKEVSVAEIEAQAESAGKGKEVTKATLSGVGGDDGSGVAIFGRVKNKLALQVVAEGLEPTATGQAYAIWLAASPTKMLPLMAVPVNQRGRIASQFEVPTEVLAYLANETFDQVAVTLVSEAKLSATLKAATKAAEAPGYTGTPVLRGQITGPIIGAAAKAKAKAGE